ncbi:MAG: hypothetical protein PHT30_02295 [Bacilli bacterium]|nr:hypothetical protein [Bacilli bacterium]
MELTLRIIATIITAAWIILAIALLFVSHFDKDAKAEFGKSYPWWIIVLILLATLSAFVLSVLWII